MRRKAYADRDPWIVAGVELGGVRAVLMVPMLKENELIGAFSVYRQKVRPFTDKQVALAQNFAAKLVIAIENARLVNELRQRTTDLTEALEQQTATSEVLQVISSSPGSSSRCSGPCWKMPFASATRVLAQCSFGKDGASFRRVALHNAPPQFLEFHKKAPVINVANAAALRRIVTEKRVVQQADLQAEEPDAPLAKYAAALYASGCVLRGQELIGASGIYRQDVRPFTDKQIALAQNFADQAVIAIENARLLKELRERTNQLEEQSEELAKLNQELEQRVTDQVGRNRTHEQAAALSAAAGG